MFKLNDNNWHSASIELNQHEARPVVDGDIISNRDMKSDFNRLPQVKSRFIIGGTNERKEGYLCCMHSSKADEDHTTSTSVTNYRTTLSKAVTINAKRILAPMEVNVLNVIRHPIVITKIRHSKVI